MHSNVTRPGSPTVTIVVPARNEARNLELVLPSLPDVHEVIVVDGHSTDHTEEAVRRTLPSARFIQQTRRGKGNALACAFEAATGDIIVMFDADGSADASEIAAFVSTLVAGADFAKGSRVLGDGGSEDITLLRDSGNRALTAITNVLFGTTYTDLCYGYNAFWRDILPVLALPSPDATEPQWGDGFEIETLINTRVAAAKLQIHEVPSVELARIHGESNLNTFRDGSRVLRTIVSERRRRGAVTVPTPAAGTLSRADDATRLHLEPHRLGSPSPAAHAHTADRAASRVLVVGSGWRFTSGISYYTCSLANAFSPRCPPTRCSCASCCPPFSTPGVTASVSGSTTSSTPTASGSTTAWTGRGAPRCAAPPSSCRSGARRWSCCSGGPAPCYTPTCAWRARPSGRARRSSWSGTRCKTPARLACPAPSATCAARWAGCCATSTPTSSTRPTTSSCSSTPTASPPATRRPRSSRTAPTSTCWATSAATPTERTEQAEPSDPSDRPFNLLYFGVIRPYKGLEDLVEAFTSLPEPAREGLHLTIVGETWEGWDAPLAAVASSPARDQITVVNRYVTDAEARQHFAEADAVVLPYRRSSSSGPLQMAMSAGLPVVVTAVGGLVEAASDYEGVRFVEPDDVAQLARAVAELPAQRGQRYPDTRSWSTTVSSYRRLFADLGVSPGVEESGRPEHRLSPVS